jgi:hypothetical protein
MADFLDPTSAEISFIDGGELNSTLRTLAEGIFAVLERSSRRPGAVRFEPRDLARTKAFVIEAIAVLGCFRGQASSTSSTPKEDLTREWIHFADLEPAPK